MINVFEMSPNHGNLIKSWLSDVRTGPRPIYRTVLKPLLTIFSMQYVESLRDCKGKYFMVTYFQPS